MIKLRKNSKSKVWNIFAANGDHLGEFTFHTSEVKAYFPGCRINKTNVYLV